MVERFNRTLKSMLRKRAAQFDRQWDNHLPALLWAYRNMPHDTTGEKPSFLLFGWDCWSPQEAALLPLSHSTQPTVIEDYREELVLTLSSARETALESIRKAQQRYKDTYDRKSDSHSYWVGDWVLIRFPVKETGKLRKLSRPWHGPYRVTSCNETNVTALKIYFPRDDPIQVHQLRVKPCLVRFPAGFFWYGAKCRGPGRPPQWVQNLLAGADGTDSPSDACFAETQNPDKENGCSLAPGEQITGGGVSVDVRDNQSVEEIDSETCGDRTLSDPREPIDDVTSTEGNLSNLHLSESISGAGDDEAMDDHGGADVQNLSHARPSASDLRGSTPQAQSHTPTIIQSRRGDGATGACYLKRQSRRPPGRFL